MQVGYCNTNGKTYKGFDLHNGEEAYMDNTTYSTYLYRDRAVDLITTYDQKKVCHITFNLIILNKKRFYCTAVNIKPLHIN